MCLGTRPGHKTAWTGVADRMQPRTAKLLSLGPRCALDSELTEPCFIDAK